MNIETEKRSAEEHNIDAMNRDMTSPDQLEWLQSTLTTTQCSIASLESRLAASQEESHTLASQELEVEKKVSENRLKALKSDKQEVEECLREELTTLRLKWDSESSQLTERVRNLESELIKQATSAEKVKQKHADNIAEYEAHLKDVKGTSEERLNKFQEAKDELEKFRKTIEAVVENLRCSLASRTNEKNAAEREVHRLGLELKNVTANCKTNVESVESRMSEMEKCHHEEVNELKKMNKHVAEECTRQKKELLTANVAFEKKKTELNQTREHVKELNCRNSELMYQAEKAIMNVTEFKKQVKLYNERFNSEAATRSSLESQIEDIVKQFSKERHSLDAKILEKINEISELTKQMANNERSYKENVESISDAHTQKVQNLNKEIEQCKHELKKVQNRSAERLKSFESKETEYKTQVEKQKGHITEIEFALKEKGAMVFTMSTQLEYLKGKEKTLKSNLTCLEAENMAIKNLQTEDNQVKRDLHKIISDKEAELTNLKLKMEENQEVRAREADRYSREMGALKQEYELVKVESSIVKENLEKVIGENSADIEVLKKSLETISAEKLSEKNNLVSEIELLKAECRAHFACKSEYESEINRLKEKNNRDRLAHCSENTKHDEKVNSLSAQLSDKESEVNTLELHITKITEEKRTIETNFKSSVEVLKSSATERESKIAELKGKLLETETYWTTQYKDLEKEYLKDTQDQRAELQSQLAELQSKFEGKLAILSNEKDAAVRNKEETCNAKMQALKKLLADKKTEIENFQVKFDEQNVNHTRMMSEMEEKLSGDLSDMNTKIYQLECQYKTMIETNDKETRNKVHNLNDKIRELESAMVALKQALNAERESMSARKAELAAMSNKLSELEGMLSNSNCLQVDRENRISELEKVVTASHENLRQLRADKSDLEGHLEYTRTRNNILTADMSSYQQKLAAVQEEKSELIARTDLLHEQRVTETHMWNDEKVELKRQLQEKQKCYDAAQKSEIVLQDQVKSLTGEQGRFVMQCQDLGRKLHAAQEVSRQLTDKGSVMSELINKLNGKLVLKRDECKRLAEVNSRSASQMESIQKELNTISQKYEQELREEKTARESMVLALEEARQKLSNEIKDRLNRQAIYEQYKKYYEKKKTVIADMHEQVKSRDQALEKARTLEETYAQLRNELNVEKAENTNLASKTHILETQLDQAEMKMQEYKQQLENQDQALEKARTIEENNAQMMTSMRNELILEQAKNKNLDSRTRFLETQPDQTEKKMQEYKQQLEKQDQELEKALTTEETYAQKMTSLRNGLNLEQEKNTNRELKALDSACIPELELVNFAETRNFQEDVERRNVSMFLMQNLELKRVVNVAVVGKSGSGTSSLINALRNMTDFESGSARTGCTSTTEHPTCYLFPNNRNLRLWDLPGYGTLSFPRKSYLHKVQFNNYDVILLVFGTRLTEDDAWMARQIEYKFPYGNLFFIRTKIDNDLENTQHGRREHLTDQEKECILEEIRRNCIDSLSCSGVKDPFIFLVNNHEIRKFDFELLMIHFIKMISDLKIKLFDSAWRGNTLSPVFGAENTLSPVLGAEIPSGNTQFLQRVRGLFSNFF